MQDIPPFNVAVFVHGTDFVLVRLEDSDHEKLAADAAARGYTYAGVVGWNGGEARTLIEPGHAAMVWCAGIGIAGRFGEHVKQHQLKWRETREGNNDGCSGMGIEC